MSIFNDNHFNSGDGMLTSVWGPPLWHSLHTISFNYPVKPTKEQKENYYNYFNSLKFVLPCRYCRDNYAENMKVLKFSKSTFKNRENLSRYVYNLHELVRSRCLNDDKNLNPKIRGNSKKPTEVIEKGCVDPLYGVKSKCVLNIVPRSSKKQSLNIDEKCKIKKKNNK